MSARLRAVHAGTGHQASLEGRASIGQSKPPSALAGGTSGWLVSRCWTCQAAAGPVAAGIGTPARDPGSACGAVAYCEDLLVVSTGTPPLSAARLEGPWTVRLKLVRRGGLIGARRWTKSWLTSP